MKHFASPSFWENYNKLPLNIKKIADKNFKLLKKDPSHPSLHYKKIKKYRSARVSRKYRTLAIEVNEGLLWFWIGSHRDYEKIIKA